MMDFRKLERANKLRREIEDVDTVAQCLERSITHGSKNREFEYPRVLRFMNRQKEGKDKVEAEVIFFSGLSIYGVEIPLDNEMCEELLEIIRHRLEKKNEEFSEIFGGTAKEIE